MVFGPTFRQIGSDSRVRPDLNYPSSCTGPPTEAEIALCADDSSIIRDFRRSLPRVASRQLCERCLAAVALRRLLLAEFGRWGHIRAIS